MKYFNLGMLLAATISSANAQTFGVFPMFDMAQNYYNPAFTASDGKTRAYLLGSYQYRPFSIFYNSTRPEINSVFDFSMPVFRRDNRQFALGLNYSRQRFDIMETNDVRINMSWLYELGKYKISYGANVDWIHDRADYSAFNHIAATFSDHSFNAGFGAAFRHEASGFYLGASANTIIHNELYSDYAGLIYKKYYSRYFISSGTDIRLSGKLLLKPSAIVFYNQYWGMSGNLLLEIAERFQLGVNYNSLRDEPCIRLGYQARHIGVHYTYGTILNFHSVSSGLHNLLLSYAFN